MTRRVPALLALVAEQQAQLAAKDEALREILDHNPNTCWGIDARDCLELVQEVARAALAREAKESQA